MQDELQLVQETPVARVRMGDALVAITLRQCVHHAASAHLCQGHHVLLNQLLHHLKCIQPGIQQLDALRLLAPPTCTGLLSSGSRMQSA